ncbi:DUF1700 domain-containing protein [Paraburkholderia bannensis]|uniref:DUF1700 domain-containing protein n=1 Tax=Paraburkholderia bannensis TaxID=765414 RepID=UPI002AB29E0D|nr:DUF1700 domain-containing protein [Paraburkholderia bannensis]
MTQDAFIQQLRHELRSLPKHVVDEIVADYREYIGDALAAGRSEAEVIAALGDPVKLARELRAQASFRQWETRRSFGNLLRVVVSIAGLGLVQLILLVPFIVYLTLLTCAYVISAAMLVAGLATVVLLGSHHAFGWPSVERIPFSFQGGSQGGDGDDSEAGDNAPDRREGGDASMLKNVNVPDFRVDGDRFVLRPQAGTHVSVVTTGGTVELRNEGGKLRVTSTGAAPAQFDVKGDVWTIQRADVVALDVRTAGGDTLSAARMGGASGDMAWDVKSDKEHVSFVEGGKDGPMLAVHSEGDSVVIDKNHVAIDSDGDHVLIVGPHGSSIGALLYGVAMLVGGALGLWLCLWLTRLTWRGLVRYVRLHAERIAKRLETGAP